MFPVTFAAADSGQYEIERIAAVSGEALTHATHLTVHAQWRTELEGVWALRGVTGHVRYVERAEKTQLDSLSPGLGRPEATCAVLIPIRKSTDWWALPQDERRAIFEERSRHTADSMKYLPRIARRLYQARELGEPFDFLTWFEFAPEHTAAFDELLSMLRSREEWTFVEREVELRLRRL
jgi:Chlorite dismutase